LSLLDAGEPFGFNEGFNFRTLLPHRGNVLPRLDIDTLCDALRRLPPEDLRLACTRKLVPLVALPGLHLYAACGKPALDDAAEQNSTVIAYAEAGDLVAAARAVHGPKLLQEATSGLARRMPAFSASRRLSDSQAMIFTVLPVLLLFAALLLPIAVSWVTASLVSGVFFLSVIAMRILCLFPPLPVKRQLAVPQHDSALPIYSVLVPLFRETSVLRQLLSAMTSLNYPALGSKRTN